VSDNALVSVVIPCRPSDVPTETVQTLFAQTHTRLELHVVIDWKGRGQSWARNRGLELVRGRYVLFSDYDVRWVPTAVADLILALERARCEEPVAPLDGAIPWRTGYAYGAFDWVHAGRAVLTLGRQQWDWAALRQQNFVPTMALVQRDVLDLTGVAFDESLRRMEDWDFWLALGTHGIRGVWTGSHLFETDVKPGVSWETSPEYDEAMRTVKRKHRVR
jgi:glycosyltransferase involved in cell wall biosynthesis